MKPTLLYLIIAFIFISYPSWSQTKKALTIRLVNPSFEDTAKQSSPPMGWADCGFMGESPPDVHPAGIWDVTTPPLDGKTYIGMTVRANDTWERISQLLEQPMQASQCYEFSIDLCRSPKYVSGINTDKKIHSFTTPCVLRIWGGNYSCHRSELLAESEPVDNEDWREFVFTFKPKRNYTYFMLEAFYQSTMTTPYNGHILLDFASDLIPIDCTNHKVIKK